MSSSWTTFGHLQDVGVAFIVHLYLPGLQMWFGVQMLHGCQVEWMGELRDVTHLAGRAGGPP